MKNLMQWKTTMLGLICFVAAIGYMFVNKSPDYMVLFGAGGVGLFLILSPDSFLTSLRRWGRKVSSKDEKN